MKRICVCGHFGFGLNMLNGQTIKTKILTEELEREYGKESLYLIDTHGRVNTLLSFLRLIYALFFCHNIVILPAHGGVRIIPLWLRLWNILFNRSLHYVVIGGWIARLLDTHYVVKWALAAFRIYAETTTMQKELRERGLENVFVLPNCKPLKIVSAEEMQNDSVARPFRLVTFSRVMKQKGIEDAVRVVSEINKESGENVFSLDIYGQIESNETKWFEELQRTFPSCISYKGCTDYDKSTETLSRYFALLFPTRFYTEGIPGTIIDAYSAGIPVISARWESFHDLIDEGETGVGYRFNDTDELKDLLLKIADNPSLMTDMKQNCIKKAVLYLPENVVPNIVFV